MIQRRSTLAAITSAVVSVRAWNEARGWVNDVARVGRGREDLAGVEAVPRADNYHVTHVLHNSVAE